MRRALRLEKAYAMIHPVSPRPGACAAPLFGWATRARRMVAICQAGKSASPLLYGQLWLRRAPGCFRTGARFGGRTRFLPVAGARPRGRGESLLPGHGAPTQVRLRHDRDHRHRLLLRRHPVQAGLQSARRSNGIEVKLGENNELLVRAPTVMRGYYNKPQATAEVMTEDGFLRRRCRRAG